VFLVTLTPFVLLMKEEADQRLTPLLIVLLLTFSLIKFFSLIFLCVVVTLLGIGETGCQ